MLSTGLKTSGVECKLFRAADLLKSDYTSASGDSPRPSVGSDEDWDMVEAQ